MKLLPEPTPLDLDGVREKLSRLISRTTDPHTQRLLTEALTQLGERCSCEGEHPLLSDVPPAYADGGEKEAAYRAAVAKYLADTDPLAVRPDATGCQRHRAFYHGWAAAFANALPQCFPRPLPKGMPLAPICKPCDRLASIESYQSPHTSWVKATCPTCGAVVYDSTAEEAKA